VDRDPSPCYLNRNLFLKQKECNMGSETARGGVCITSLSTHDISCYDLIQRICCVVSNGNKAKMLFIALLENADSISFLWGSLYYLEHLQ
jgi:hypothetical protein